ncbi:MAG: aromatic acid exporter family protein, partial [Jatrophihabitans sp.]|uniref:aromatic acid exporter family protein n=1 Tax=Jatrophihabitans sp. TaxID=1932789 RepID=UPI003F81C819
MTAGARARRIVDVQRQRLRDGGRPAAARTLRLTAAATAAFVVARAVIGTPKPTTAALTALLVVQVTLVGTLADTARRIVSVVVGVGIAIVVADLLGFTWWSLALITAAALAVGQLLRLGPHLLEVPISAMLILAVGGAGLAATDRVYETLVGAGVGLAASVLLPPRVRTRTAGAAIERLADDLGRLLDEVAAALAEREVGRDEAQDWLRRVRSLDHDIGRVDRVLVDAGESRRLNPRALGTVDSTPDLRSGLDALERSAVNLRAVFRSLADGAVAPGAGEADEASGEPSTLVEAELRRAVGVLMTELAASVRAFGTLVRAEVDDADDAHTAELAAALTAVGEARALLAGLLLADVDPAVWPLRGSLLAAVDRLLGELDV